MPLSKKSTNDISYMDIGSSLKNKIIVTIIVLITLLGGCTGWFAWRVIYAENFTPTSPVRIYINKTETFDGVCQMLRDSAFCSSMKTFRVLAKWMKYPQYIKTGCYAIHGGMNNLEVVQMLRSGQQETIQLTFNNIRTKQDLAARFDDVLMLSAGEISGFLNDSAWCASEGFDTTTIKTMFIPNTYDVYWNVSAKALLSRMKREYEHFWSGMRKQKALEVGLTPIEISILASIVEEETSDFDEYPVVAGLYINRLKRGMLLQADPTVKYAIGDFTLRRILYKHLEVDSPYNTYKHAGLPPGPLRIPSIQAIDGVLNYAKHDYLYMCAKEDMSGKHNFARTLGEHNRNARRYQAALNKLKIQ